MHFRYAFKKKCTFFICLFVTLIQYAFVPVINTNNNTI